LAERVEGDDAASSSDPSQGAPGVGLDAVVVAAGTSSRMGGLDKLDVPIAGVPLLAWSIDALAGTAGVERIVVVTAADRLVRVSQASWLNRAVVAVVAGGPRRQESVAAGVSALDPPDDRVVLIHDGARPAVQRTLVARVAAAATEHGAAIPVLPVAETVKRLQDGLVLETLDRSSLVTAQTPQAVRMGLLRAAWQRFPPADAETFTDEAALLEAARIPVHAIPGDPTNLKVTVLDDLGRVTADLLGRSALKPTGTIRVGIGADSHGFGPGGPLRLGGIEVPGAPRLHGHSDGDVALHAVADALLGAAGLGDLGRLFPAGPETPRGVASSSLVLDVLKGVIAAGYSPRSVDLTIVGARPRLARYLDAMRDAIADLLQVPPQAVNVKASTGNLEGAAGAGRGMTAHAIVVIAPHVSGAG
jgi:2-C-methyl-D-erythritol 4-phosphate cytidylyltransferase / 2-C-methyl-D-erythritol 2,4-cyclodiphosphate synthase